LQFIKSFRNTARQYHTARRVHRMLVQYNVIEHLYSAEHMKYQTCWIYEPRLKCYISYNGKTLGWIYTQIL